MIWIKTTRKNVLIWVLTGYIPTGLIKKDLRYYLVACFHAFASSAVFFLFNIFFCQNFCHRDIFRLGIHPYRVDYTYWNIFGMDPSFYSILQSEVLLMFFFRDMDCQLCLSISLKWINHLRFTLRIYLLSRLTSRQ